MDDEVVRIAVGLRLGVPLCQPHYCYHCGAAVDELATHSMAMAGAWLQRIAVAMQRGNTATVLGT